MLKESMQAIEAYAEAGAKGVVVGAIYLKGKPEKNTLAMYTELDRGLKHQITKELKKENYKQDGDYFWSYDHTLKWHQILRKVAHASGIKYFPADSPSRLIGDAASPFGTSLIGLKGPSNNCALTELAYESPNDFGLHQIDLTKPNLQSDGLRLWHSSSAKRADLASKGIKTVADVIRYWYNDPKWVRGLIPYSKPFGVDSNGDIHYRVDSKYLDFCREGRSV
jgi:hypothetical protein